MFGIKTKMKRFVACRKWSSDNSHNGTNLGKWLIGTKNVQIGEFTYGDINVLTAGEDPSLKIGACCSIAKDVTFVIDNSHPLDRFSTFPFKVKALGTERREALSEGGIVLEDDVWIGYRSIILDGVHIGRGGSSLRGRSSRRMWSLTPSSAACPQNLSKRGSAKNLSIVWSNSIIRRWTKVLFGLISISSTARWASVPSGSC